MILDGWHLMGVFVEPVLGTVNRDEELYKSFLQGKYAEEHEGDTSAIDDELETLRGDEKVEDELEKQTTGFHRLGEQFFLYDYIFKGYAKESVSALRRSKESKVAKLQAFKKVIDGAMVIMPRRIELHPGGEMFYVERPLRAQTAQGERVAIARSEALPEGTTFECDIMILKGTIPETMMSELFEDYCYLKGLGQWRNASWGRFGGQLTKLDDKRVRDLWTQHKKDYLARLPKGTPLA